MIKQIPGFNNYFADIEGNIYSNKSGELKKLNSWSKKDNRRRKTENNYLNAKLNYQIAEEIRNKYSTKQYTQKQLGIEYNVSKTTIGDIIRNKYYVKDYNISNV